MDFCTGTQTLTLIFVVTFYINASKCILFAADDIIPCGKPEIEPIAKRIVGGNEAQIGAWPWMALLAEDGFHICGGSILNERIILTTAHCFDSDKIPSRWTIYTGKHYLTKVESTQTKHRIDRIITFPGYNNLTLRHDIALVVLRDPITFSNLVRPICLPPTYRRMVPSDTLCYTAGWGDTRGTADPYTLNQVGLPLLNDYWCSRPDWYGSIYIPRLTFCAGYQEGRKDACTGDSGGPYICKVNGTWYQQGIVSWGIECGLPRKPGVFTDVSKYRNWIVKTMNNTGYPLES